MKNFGLYFGGFLIFSWTEKVMSQAEPALLKTHHYYWAVQIKHDLIQMIDELKKNLWAQ